MANATSAGRKSKHGSQQISSPCSSKDDSLNYALRSQSMPPPEPMKSGPPLVPISVPIEALPIHTEEQLIKKATNILNEFLADPNINNAFIEIRETFDNSTFANCVRAVLNYAVKKSATTTPGAKARNGNQQFSSRSSSKDKSLHDALQSQSIPPSQSIISVPPPVPISVPIETMPTLTVEQLIQKATNILNEIITDTNINNAFIEIRENFDNSTFANFVREVLNYAVEKFATTSNYTEEDIETEALYESVRGVLNKLTPQNVKTSADQLRALEIDTEARMRGVVGLVFEKAIDEPSFSAALMCKELASMRVSGPDGKTETEESDLNFRKYIIGRCQTEFEKITADIAARAVKLEEIDETTDPEKKKELLLPLEEEESKMRIKSVGTVRFIGDLYKQGMLTSNIMHRCIRHLVHQIDEESLECLCKLLSTVGKDLESEKQNLDKYFNQMTDIVNSQVPGEVSSQVRFMLQDVIELRMNNWVPRRHNSNPETMDQVQNEAETERLGTHMDNIPMNTPRKDDRNNVRKRNRGGGPTELNGWSSPVRGSRQQHSVETHKFKNKLTSNNTEENIKTEALYESVRGVLNKLTPQNVETSADQLEALEIDTKARMCGVVGLVFEKAIEEPSFTVAAALLCKELAWMQVRRPDGKTNKGNSNLTFGKLLITRCQTEFEKTIACEIAHTIKLKENTETTDPQKKNELLLISAKKKRSMLNKSVGIVRFIGRLFKQRMLSSNIVHTCINVLMRPTDNANIKCLYELLLIVGKNLEYKKQKLDTCFNQMRNIVNRKVPGEVSSTVRSKLRYLIELRKNNWVPRRNFNNLKRNDPIDKKAETKSIDTHMKNIPTNTPRKGDRNNDRKRNRGRGPTESNGCDSPVHGSQQQPPVATPELQNEPIPLMQIRATSDNSTVANFVRESLNYAVEKSVTARQEVSQLLTHLIVMETLPLSIYLTALGEVLETAKDLVIDIPMIWVYLAELICCPLAEDIIPFDELRNIMAPLKNEGLAGKLLGELLKLLVQEKDPNWIQERWKESDLQWDDFFQGNESVPDFLKEFKLEFMEGESDSSLSSSGEELGMETIQEVLFALLSNVKAYSFDIINSWISATVGSREYQPEFIGVVVTAILRVSFESHSDGWEFNEDRFDNLQPLIVRYLDANESLKAPCFIAIQEYTHKLELPEDVLWQIAAKLW